MSAPWWFLPVAQPDVIRPDESAPVVGLTSRPAKSAFAKRTGGARGLPGSGRACRLCQWHARGHFVYRNAVVGGDLDFPMATLMNTLHGLVRPPDAYKKQLR